MCGSRRIRRRTIDLEVRIDEKRIIVPSIELDICPACEVMLFDHEANVKFEHYCPPRKHKAKKPRKVTMRICDDSRQAKAKPA